MLKSARVRRCLTAGLGVFLVACASGPRWRGAPGRAQSAVRSLDTTAMLRALEDVFARYNVPPPPSEPGSEDATAIRLTRARVANATAASAGRDDPRVGMLVFFATARHVADAVMREHLPPARVAAAPLRLPEEHAAAAVAELARQNAALRDTLQSALALARSLPPSGPQLPTAVMGVAQRLSQPAPPLPAQLAKHYPHAFDRETARVLRAMPRLRACTLRSVDAPEGGSSAAVTQDGRLFLAVPGAVREVPRAGPERRRRLDVALGPGQLVHAPWSPRKDAPAGFELWHVRAVATYLDIKAFRLTPEAAPMSGSIVLRGTDFVPELGVEWVQDIPVLLVARRQFPGLREVAIRLDTRKHQKGAVLPGAPGHRDGALGQARFSLGPSVVTRAGERLFYDPAARALRILARGVVGTVATEPRRDGVGEGAGVGHVVALASAADGTLYVAERGRLDGGFRRYHLRALTLDGRPCRAAGARSAR